MDQGLPGRIFRPALIGPALDGRGTNLDIAMRLLAFIVGHAVSVDTQNQVSFVPVDVAANNIVAIACQPDTLNQTFHVTRDRLADSNPVFVVFAQGLRSRSYSQVYPR